MMPSFFMHAVVGAGAPSTYLSLGGVLTMLVLVTLWRESITTDSDQFFPRTFATLAFVASRVVGVVFTGAILAEPTMPPFTYVLLNFTSLYLAAICFPMRGQHDEGADTAAMEDAHVTGWRTTRFQAIMFALLGALVYVVVPHTSGVGFSLVDMLAVALLGASLRLTIRIFMESRNTAREVRPILMLFAGSLGLSWLLVTAASVTEGGTAIALLNLSHAADVGTLAAGLLALQSNYLVRGFQNMRLASWKHEEAEQARAKLTQLNRVASDIYEDSSSMIQRQQLHSRELMRRIKNLETILAIGVQTRQMKNTKELLQVVAESIRVNFGFDTVIMRLLNENTQSFETKAYVASNLDAMEVQMNHRLPLSEYERMTDPRQQISRSFFLRRGVRADAQKREDAGAQIVVANGWEEIECIIVPMVDDTTGATVGYLSVEDAKSEMSVVEAIENLETVAALAVTAIRNADYIREVADKNHKLKLFAEKLASLNKLKSNFVATVSHEFRTPLTSIKAYCETLLKNADNVDRNILKEFLIVIDEESDRLMTLIEDILDFSQMESGAIKFERSPCDMKDIITEAAGELEKSFERKNITLTTNAPEGDVMVRAEKELMRQLMVNLLHNASKFTPENGNVWVWLVDENVAARIVIEDNGIGIPDDQLEQIFDDFHQVDNSATRQYGGTGIGLAICKNIVDWHDGRIWVENIPGRGARFVVVIPKKQAVVRSQALNADGAIRRYEMERYVELLVETIAELMNVRRVSLMLLDEAGAELRIETAIGLDEEIVEHAGVKLGEGIAGRVAVENQSYLVRDIETDKRVATRNNDYLYSSKSFLSVPVRVDSEVVGVINVSNPGGRKIFGQDDCYLLELFADRVASALESLRDFVDNSREFERVRDAFKSILDAKRYIADQRAETMTLVVRDLARALKMSNRETALLQYIYSVYDLGLAKVGYNIINQPRDLSGQDRRSLEEHTIIGTEMLKSIDNAHAVRDAVLYHHENYDGSGYPGHLAGEEIPLEARVIRVVDTFRALISHRPYQKQYTVAEAVDVLEQRSGSYFDPKIVEAFVSVIEQYADRFTPEAVTEVRVDSDAGAETGEDAQAIKEPDNEPSYDDSNLMH